MGGYNSGRHSSRRLVEGSLTLNINMLLRQRAILPGRHCFGSLTWTYGEASEKRASIGYKADLTDPTAAWMRLHYTVNGIPKDYTVKLEATPCTYGGVRWWWVCPVLGRRAAKLHLPPGAAVFASRQAHLLAYRSQRQMPMDRSHARQRRLYAKLGEKYQIFEQPPPRRPKGMRRATYERLTERLYDAMKTHNAIFQAGAAVILARPQRRRLSPR